MVEHGEKTPGTIGQIDSGELPGDTVGEGLAREAWMGRRAGNEWPSPTACRGMGQAHSL